MMEIKIYNNIKIIYNNKINMLFWVIMMKILNIINIIDMMVEEVIYIILYVI
jgi:hypothetical protein